MDRNVRTCEFTVSVRSHELSQRQAVRGDASCRAAKLPSRKGALRSPYDHLEPRVRTRMRPSVAWRTASNPYA